VNESGPPPAAADADTVEPLEPGAPTQVSLPQRLRQPRTIISIALPLVLVVLVFRVVLQVDFGQLGDLVLAANPAALLAALAIYYLGFPLRGYRWGLLLRGTGFSLRTKDASELIFLSWLVNCLVPAKLGDVYRAYLLRLNYVVSLSRTFGTVFLERILDLFGIAILALGSGYWSFRANLPPEVQVLLGIGVAVIVLLAAGLFTLRNFGRRLLALLPLPQRVSELYDRFEEGVFNSIGVRQLPRLGVLTGLVWGTEAARLWLVIAALGFTDVHLGISGTFFVALAASLLTAIPFTPAGVGVVEAGVVGILTVIYSVDATSAAAIALVDRAISVLSIIVFGGLLYAVSAKVRGRGGDRVAAAGPVGGDRAAG